MPAILVGAPITEPVTLAAAKAHLRITHSDDDLLLLQLITSARRVAEARTGLCFLSQAWLCLQDAWPGDLTVRLPVSPLIAVTEVAVLAADAAKTVLDPALYEADLASRPPRLMPVSGAWPLPGRLLNGIAIAVTAGFGAAPEAVPEPLRQAMLLMVAHWYGNRGEEAGSQLAPSIAALLAPYRAVRP
jgi:uncharacterized phiE125 gp8 family phage protein